MAIREQLLAKKEKLAVVGLGYVGLPIAVAFSASVDVIGFDINERKIEQYRRGIDVTQEVGSEMLARCDVAFTSDAARLHEAAFIIVAVPTPVDSHHLPDLSLLRQACETVGRFLKRGAIVVFESTVYPGVTEEICQPILEEASGMVCGRDFFIGYSPERINPGDQQHRLDTIVKVVSGMDEHTANEIADVYRLVAKAGVHLAPSMKVAEAAKVIENSQRDINIAFMNELSVICHRLGIDTKDVLEAAGTKWNFLPFYPGLVGGHCVGVDPYYLTYKAAQLGVDSRIIAMGRAVNDGMGEYVAAQTVKVLLSENVVPAQARVAILGLTFKENCPDTRNTRVIDIYRALSDYGVSLAISDPIADAEEVYREYGLYLTAFDEIRDMDAVILAVPHKAYEDIGAERMDALYRNDRNGKRILVDIRGLLDKAAFEEAAYRYWRL